MIALYIYSIQIIWYVVIFPYTKVEESFNVQAIHDHLEYFILNNNLSHYDHLLFPGVVPRSFIASLVLAFFTCPFHILRWYLQLPKIYSLYAFRIILGFITWISFSQFIHSIKYKFGRRCALLTLIASILQCHIPFYSSRTLPNTYGLIFTYWAYSYWFYNQPLKCLILIGTAIILFRCDLILLLLPIFVFMITSREIQFLQALKTGVFFATLVLFLTIVIDSYFWHSQSALHSNYNPFLSLFNTIINNNNNNSGSYNNHNTSTVSSSSPSPLSYWLWPEGSVLYFNTIQNKSKEWGVQPWHWYFTSALPRCLNFMFPLSLLGFLGIIRYPSMNKIIAMFDTIKKQQLLQQQQKQGAEKNNDDDDDDDTATHRPTVTTPSTTTIATVDVSMMTMILSFIHLSDFQEFYCFLFPPPSTISPLNAQQQLLDIHSNSTSNMSNMNNENDRNNDNTGQPQQQRRRGIRLSKRKRLKDVNHDDDDDGDDGTTHGYHINNSRSQGLSTNNNNHQHNTANNHGIGISNNNTSSGTSSNNFLGITSVTSASARQRVVAYYSGPVLCYLGLYSFLPHKELRFLFPVLPILTWLTAVAIDQISSPLVYQVKSHTHRHRRPFSNNSNNHTHYNFRNSLIHTNRNTLNKSYASSTLERTNTTEVSIVSNTFPFDSLVYITFDIVESYMYGFDHEEIYFLLRKSNQLQSIQNLSVTMRILNTTISCLWCLTIFTSVLTSLLFSAASYSNYPGGSALYSLVNMHLPTSHAATAATTAATAAPIVPHVTRVHIAPAAAMTGIARFGQEDYVMNMQVTYSKAEHLTAYDDFDWLITDDPIGSGKVDSFRVSEVIYGFEKFSFRFRQYHPPHHHHHHRMTSTTAAAAAVANDHFVNKCRGSLNDHNHDDSNNIGGSCESSSAAIATTANTNTADNDDANGDNSMNNNDHDDDDDDDGSCSVPLLPPLIILNSLYQYYHHLRVSIPIVYLHKRPQLYILCNIHNVVGCSTSGRSSSSNNSRSRSRCHITHTNNTTFTTTTTLNQ